MPNPSSSPFLMSEEVIVDAAESGMRLDKLLALRFPNCSRTYFQYLIDQGLVLVNGDQVKKRLAPEPGDVIEIEFTLTPEIALTPEPIPLEILYEDETLIAINKPAGMVVHPGAGNPSGTFVNALLFHCKQLPQTDRLRPGIVHRLDKDTTGVLVAAKTEASHFQLVEKFASRSIRKEYLAICVGTPKHMTIDAPIGRHPVRRKEMAVTPLGGKAAKTLCEPIAHGPHLSYVRLLPETGRTHQLRVHLKHIGTPILGDATYGSPSLNKKYHATRQLLHAHRLCFEHPITKEEIELKASVPQDMQKYIDMITTL